MTVGVEAETKVRMGVIVGVEVNLKIDLRVKMDLE